MEAQEKMTAKVFINKILQGTALGVIIGLIPNAVLSAILKYFSQYPLAVQITQIAVIFQLATPLIIGTLIALQFGFKPMPMMVTAGASFVASGVVKFNPELGKYVGAGTGDLINTMLTAAIGAVINEFTHLQPILMSILIVCSFAFLIISPISTVAIGLAIQLNGVSAGAAAMGVAVTAVVLVVHSWKVNNSGVTLAIALGAMKLMMPNLFKYPIILVPTLTTAVISAIPVALFSVSGTPQSAGFGLVGLVGPLASIDAGLNVALAVVVWLVVPVVAALATKFVYEKVLKLYDSNVVFKFQQ